MVRIPIPTGPVLVVRGGGAKLLGDFPFHEAAFIGGANSVRLQESQRYAGDASLFGTAELRIPVVGFSFVLPVDAGIVGLFDVGRVYLDGASPGGWHPVSGGGLWLGVAETAMIVTLTLTSERGRSGVQLHSGFNF
jgi:hypothetical protein